ncbi:hypothetical protein MIND_00162400 [Mycena indigotica]|uniref:PH domain-containing protein n=1 Tax=Mycena indigotica TaxID=2126181 RepID=A0A8H6WL45_9AGAR|nr:uncharacterized protein MIND_00162400 [Mycena indigotica]KAF7316434.1 hypothetical protein MIND_00162400 [Mycena indigotica]
MDRPRANSVMQVRSSQSAFQLRASKLFQKVSSKFTRSSPDPGGTPSIRRGPYMHSASLDGGVKPYMSQPMLGLMLSTVEDNGDSDGSDSPVRSEMDNSPLPHASTRPPLPSRAIPPTPNSNSAKPPLSLNSNPPSVNLPIVTPPTPVSPTTLDSQHAEQHPTRRDSLPALRRSRSQTLSDGRNWSRPSSTVFGASAQAALGMGIAVALGGNTTPGEPSSISTVSPTSSYATARASAISTASTSDQSVLSGLPVLDRQETVTSGLPLLPSNTSSAVNGVPVDGLPFGAAPAVDPHQYYPVQRTSISTITPPLTPSTSSQKQPTNDHRRASVASFASVTSVDSFTTARSGGWSEDEANDDDEGGMTPTVGDDEAKDIVMPLENITLSREDTLRGGEPRERAETLRGTTAPPHFVLNSPTSSKIIVRDSPPTPTRSNPPSPTTSTINPSSSPSTSFSPPSSPKALSPPRSPMRAASLPPITTVPLVIPTAPIPSIPPRSSVILRASPSSGSLSGSPWGSENPSTIPRTRTASAGNPSPSSAMSTSTVTRSFTGTLPARRPPSIPMSLHRYSMAFNPGAPLSPGGSDLGRLSPSIIVRQPPLAIPVLKLPSISSPAPEPSPASSGTVGRRSSVIFGPHGAHERETSKAVVKSMPALAMEGTAEVETAAGESDSDNEDDDGGDDGGEGDEDEDDSQRPSVDDSRDETESPFVPLRLNTSAPLSLDLDGLLNGVGLGLGSPIISKGKESVASVMQPQASQKTVTGPKTPQAQAQSSRTSDYFSIRSPSAEGRTPMPASSPLMGMAAIPRTVPMPPLPSPAGERPGMYKHASRSMVDILNAPEDEPPVSSVNAAKSKEDERGAAPAYDGHGVQRGSTLRRRRSMPEVSAAPPPYTSPMFPLQFLDDGESSHLHPLAQARIAPREDEGREVLPPYSNSILLRSVMPRKMEFSEPGVQAKDRKWRRVICELEGTVFRVYRCQAEGWWERKVGVGDLAQASVGNAALAAAAAIKARAAARDGAQDIKLAAEEGRLDAMEESSGAENGEGTTEIPVAPRPSMSSSSRSRASSTATSASPTQPSSSSSITDMSSSASRSRLNLGLGLLKPRSHGRSKSDLPNPPRSPVGSRSSLSIPRPSFSSSTPPMPTSTSGAPLTSSRSNVSLASSRSPLTSSPPSAKAKGKQKATDMDVPEPDPSDLIRAYTLQHAESGLGNDYLKRKHVIRVRLEGEQFLLQARDVGDVVDWIEALHCATNIALDLDERPMPKGPLFPRRRRRRNRPTQGQGETAAVPSTAV